jgi:hypothetical protein
MVEEKKDKVQVLRDRRRASRGATFWLIAAGFVALFVGIAFNAGVSTFEDTKHLSTPNIPLKDAQNATYSFTAKEVKDQGLMVLLVCALVAVALVAAGYTILFVNPGERELHMVHCKGSTEGNYCPECGMNLKKMEKHKQD